jgi:hypothetical protein
VYLRWPIASSAWAFRPRPQKCTEWTGLGPPSRTSEGEGGTLGGRSLHALAGPSRMQDLSGRGPVQPSDCNTSRRAGGQRFHTGYLPTCHEVAPARDCRLRMPRATADALEAAWTVERVCGLAEELARTADRRGVGRKAGDAAGAAGGALPATSSILHSGFLPGCPLQAAKLSGSCRGCGTMRLRSGRAVRASCPVDAARAWGWISSHDVPSLLQAGKVHVRLGPPRLQLPASSSGWAHLQSSVSPATTTRGPSRGQS